MKMRLNNQKPTLVALVPPLFQKLTEWPQNTCWRRELEHNVQNLWFSRQHITYSFEIHGHLGFAEM